jgi:chemotaxis protein MotB
MASQTLRKSLLALSATGALALSSCVSQSAYNELQTQNQQLQTQNQKLGQQLGDCEAHVTRLQGAIKYTVESDLLFPSGSWQISARGKQIIARIASKMAANQQDKIYINGYTDNTPIGPGLKQQGVMTNEQLSQKRADAVMNYMISQGVKADLISAHGYGEADPAASNATVTGRAQNRRVELTLAPPSQPSS